MEAAGKYLVTGAPVTTTTAAVLKLSFENTTPGTNLELCAGTGADFAAGTCPTRLSDSGGPGFVNPKSKDPKTFFFFDYQGQRIRQGQSYVSSVPLPAFKNGDFSASASLIFDPLTTTPSGTNFARQQFPGNMIPAARIDSVGKNLINLYPAPNAPGLVNNYLFNPVRITTANDWDLKFDHRFSDSDSTWVR
jgi:hypothetical protein